MVTMQVRGRACDQHQEGDEYRRDSAQTQTCSELYCVHMGSQIIHGILGRHESVSCRNLSDDALIEAR
jgi:hypothetical protein